jgi:hypothetical protein
MEGLPEPYLRRVREQIQGWLAGNAKVEPCLAI